MKARNLKLSLLILGSLIILSFAFFSYAQEKAATDNNVFLDSDQDGLSDAEEKTYGTNPHSPDTDGDSYSDGAEVKSGYDPTKPAPGDKLIQEKANVSALDSNSANADNMTETMIARVNALANSDPLGENKEASMEELQNIVAETLSSQNAQTSLPEISQDEIKIKKQNYSKLSAEKRKIKEKEDFTRYIVAVSYILSSNSPKPITSKDDMTTVFSSLGRQVVSAITTQDPKTLDDLSKSEGKILEQMKDIEVPEKEVDLHIKGMQLAKYSMTLKDSLAPNAADPLASLVNLSKTQAFMDSSMGFFDEIQSKVGEYGLDYSGELKDSLTKMGLPDLSVKN
jgi:hypothetical protein